MVFSRSWIQFKSWKQRFCKPSKIFIFVCKLLRTELTFLAWEWSVQMMESRDCPNHKSDMSRYPESRGWRQVRCGGARLRLCYLTLLIFRGRSSGSGMLSQHLHFRHGVTDSWSHGHTRAAFFRWRGLQTFMLVWWVSECSAQWLLWCLSRISILGIFAHYVILIDFLQKLTFTFDCLLQFLLFFVSLCRPLFVAVADQKTLQSTFATYELWSWKWFIRRKWKLLNAAF